MVFWHSNTLSDPTKIPPPPGNPKHKWNIQGRILTKFMWSDTRGPHPNSPPWHVVCAQFTSGTFPALIWGLSDPTAIPPPHRGTGVAIPLSHCVSCGIADYSCYTPTSFLKNGLSRSKDRPWRRRYRRKSLPLKPIALQGASHEIVSPIAQKWDTPILYFIQERKNWPGPI